MLKCGQRDAADAQLRRAIEMFPNWQPSQPEKAYVGHWTAAYFLDKVTQEQYAMQYQTHPTLGERFACYPWFYIGQRKEIEGRRDEAIAAYRKSVELGKLPDAHFIHNWSAYRLGRLTGTISPPTSEPASAPASQ